ncbi:vascular endothelial growth factor receptor 1 [Anabrus simplex]|uniref:vascular endothelial growth factor receptor 1 n=1 Tax=Anabrus simplex TaxID=316456 RepID=UPI0035A37690
MAMMDTVRVLLSVSLITGFLTSWYALAANITSFGGKEEIIINSGDDIDLTCESSWPMNWTIPYIEDSVVEVNNSIKENPEFRHVSRLYLPNAQHYHTGFYKCYDEDNIMREDSIYIYVKNETYPFVQKDVLIYLPVHQYETAVFDCRPNAPDIVVQLQTTTGEVLALGENSEDGTKLEYDPKIGFTMHFVNNKQGGLYNCIAGENELMLLLQIMRMYHFVFCSKY